jgi:hypothetical protein
MFPHQILTCFGWNHLSLFFIIIFQNFLLSSEFFKPNLKFLGLLFEPLCHQTSHCQSDAVVKVKVLIIVNLFLPNFHLLILKNQKL